MAAPAVPAPVFRSSVAMPRLGTWQPDTAAAVACAVAFVSIESIVGTSDASTLAVVVLRLQPLLPWQRAGVGHFSRQWLSDRAPADHRDEPVSRARRGVGQPARMDSVRPRLRPRCRARHKSGLVGVLLLTIGLQATSSTFNPFFVMLTLGPWIGGRVLGSRRRIVARIEQRNLELVAEQVRYVRERVRLERARIALDLHDIVAHQMTLIAIQAAAAQRGNGSPATTSAALTCIVEAAGEARDEVGRLTRPAALPPVTIGQIDRTRPPCTGQRPHRALPVGRPSGLDLADPGRDGVPDRPGGSDQRHQARARRRRRYRASTARRPRRGGSDHHDDAATAIEPGGLWRRFRAGRPRYAGSLHRGRLRRRAD